MTWPELLHYSNQPLGPVTSREQLHGESKPDGLWCSVGIEWEEWCRQEEFQLDHLKHVHVVTLREDANLRHISGSAELDRFSAQYRLTISELFPACYTAHFGLIDWVRVAADYGGIVIAPYCWERRFTSHTHWYHGWDCASACIWDARQIEAVRLID